MLKNLPIIRNHHLFCLARVLLLAYYFKPGIAIKHILLSTSRHCSVAEDPMQKQSKMINIVKPKNIGSRTLDYIHERPAYRRSHFGSPCLQISFYSEVMDLCMDLIGALLYSASVDMYFLCIKILKANNPM